MDLFANTKVAFRDKDDNSLRKAYWLFRLVGNPLLVKIGSMLLNLALWLRIPVRWVLKPTVFDHFCGGERIDDCDATIELLGRSGVQTILDYSAEGKDSEEDLEYTKEQIIATVDKAAAEHHIPYAVFKPSGVARFALLEKVLGNDPLSPDEQEEFDRVKKRFDAICSYGKSRNVPVMIDSEESWIQDVVDGMVEELMFRYNRGAPVVFNTLQMYRHDRLEYLQHFIERARKNGVYPAFKLVRGAYMEKERARARRLSYLSPIYPDKESTDKAFDDATTVLLEAIDHAAVCIATHNEASCLHAIDLMKTRSIPADNPNVSFAQLLGMSDHISYNLAAEGYIVCKYVPYGPVKTVVPYLVRRAEENTSVAGQTSRELYLLRTEIRRRKALRKAGK